MTRHKVVTMRGAVDATLKQARADHDAMTAERARLRDAIASVNFELTDADLAAERVLTRLADNADNGERVKALTLQLQELQATIAAFQTTKDHLLRQQRDGVAAADLVWRKVTDAEIAAVAADAFPVILACEALLEQLAEHGATLDGLAQRVRELAAPHAAEPGGLKVGRLELTLIDGVKLWTDRALTVWRRHVQAHVADWRRRYTVVTDLVDLADHAQETE